MPQPFAFVEPLLDQFNISYERYVAESLALVNAGFSQRQADRFILHSGTEYVVRAILKNCEVLLAPPYGLDREQIVKIARHSGGANNIKAVVEWFVTLTQLGFNPEQIVKIVGHCGGSVSIGVVLKTFTVFKKLKLTHDQIAKLTGQDGSYEIACAFLKCFSALQAKGHTVESMVALAGNKKGAKRIYAEVSELEPSANEKSKCKVRRATVIYPKSKKKKPSRCAYSLEQIHGERGEQLEAEQSSSSLDKSDFNDPQPGNSCTIDTPICHPGHSRYYSEEDFQEILNDLASVPWIEQVAHVPTPHMQMNIFASRKKGDIQQEDQFLFEFQEFESSIIDGLSSVLY